MTLTQLFIYQPTHSIASPGISRDELQFQQLREALLSLSGRLVSPFFGHGIVPESTDSPDRTFEIFQ